MKHVSAWTILAMNCAQPWCSVPPCQLTRFLGSCDLRILMDQFGSIWLDALLSSCCSSFSPSDLKSHHDLTKVWTHETNQSSKPLPQCPWWANLQLTIPVPSSEYQTALTYDVVYRTLWGSPISFWTGWFNLGYTKKINKTTAVYPTMVPTNPRVSRLPQGLSYKFVAFTTNKIW